MCGNAQPDGRPLGRSELRSEPERHSWWAVVITVDDIMLMCELCVRSWIRSYLTTCVRTAITHISISATGGFFSTSNEVHHLYIFFFSSYTLGCWSKYLVVAFRWYWSLWLLMEHYYCVYLYMLCRLLLIYTKQLSVSGLWVHDV